MDDAPAAPAPVAAPPAPDAVPADTKWSKALVWAGGKAPAASEKRGIVVAEVRTDDGQLAVPTTYPQNGDIYFRTDPLTDFGGKSSLLLGDSVEQGLLWGLSIKPGIVHVGPAHPAYAAINLATLQGATEVEVQGLSPFWKARLGPWIGAIKTDPWYPSDVKVTLT